MATLEPPHAREALLLRFGAVAAIVGTAFQVAAGSSQTASIDAGADAALPALAEQPDWAWPVISCGFLFGALLWVLALVVLASTMRGRPRPGVNWPSPRSSWVRPFTSSMPHSTPGRWRRWHGS